MRGCLLPPLHCFGRVLGYAFAFGIHPPEIVLRHRIPLRGSLLIPLHCLGCVLGDTFTVGIHPPKEGLHKGVPGLRVLQRCGKHLFGRLLYRLLFGQWGRRVSLLTAPPDASDSGKRQQETGPDDAVMA